MTAALTIQHNLALVISSEGADAKKIVQTLVDFASRLNSAIKEFGPAFIKPDIAEVQAFWNVDDLPSDTVRNVLLAIFRVKEQISSSLADDERKRFSFCIGIDVGSVLIGNGEAIGGAVTTAIRLARWAEENGGIIAISEEALLLVGFGAKTSVGLCAVEIIGAVQSHRSAALLFAVPSA